MRAYTPRPLTRCPRCMPLHADSDWRREALANLRLALPLIAAQIAGVGMGTVDTVFAGRLGARALAAVALGVNVNVLFFVFCMGLLMAVSPIVAHRRAVERDDGDLAGLRRSALKLALFAGALWCLGLNLLAPWIAARTGVDEATAVLAVHFMRALSGSSFGFAMWFALRFFAEGASRSGPVFLAGVVGLLVNALLDWLLMFGHLGLPALGVVGCGIATSLSSLILAAALLTLHRRTPGLREVARAVPLPQRRGEGVPELLRLGLPIGTILLLEAGLFVLAALLMSRFGDIAMAAFQVAINFAALMFMIPVGLGQATTVRVGLAAGAGRLHEARRRGHVGMGLGLANAGSNALIMAVAAGPIAALYSRDPAIATQAAHFLLYAAAFQFVDGLQVTANGALRGLKDTRGPMALTLFAYWGIGFPVAVVLAFATAFGADGIWLGLTAGLAAAAVGLSWRFRRRSLDPATLSNAAAR